MSTLHPSVEDLEASIRSLVVPCQRLAPVRKPGGVESPCRLSPVASNRIGSPNLNQCCARGSKPKKFVPNKRLNSGASCSNSNVNNGNGCHCQSHESSPPCSHPVPLRVTNVLGQCLQMDYAPSPRGGVLVNGRDPCINVLGQRQGVWEPPCRVCPGAKTSTIGQALSHCPQPPPHTCCPQPQCNPCPQPPISAPCHCSPPHPCPQPKAHCSSCCCDTNPIGQGVDPSPHHSTAGCCPSYNVIGQRVKPHESHGGHC